MGLKDIYERLKAKKNENTFLCITGRKEGRREDKVEERAAEEIERYLAEVCQKSELDC